MITKEELAKMEKAHLSIGTTSTRLAMSNVYKEQIESKKDIQLGVEVYKLFKEVGLCKSHSETKRLIRQGGLYLNGEKVKDPYSRIKPEAVIDGVLKLQRGKKRFFTINIK